MHERDCWSLRRYGRVYDADRVPRWDIQPQLVLQLLIGLPDDACWQLLRISRGCSYPMPSWHMAEPDGAGQLHECHCWALRGHERVRVADRVRCWDVQPQLVLQLIGRLPRYTCW